MSDLNKIGCFIQSNNLELAIQLGIGTKIPVNDFVEVWFKFPKLDKIELGAVNKEQFIKTWEYNEYILSYLVQYSIITLDDGSETSIYDFSSIGLLILDKCIERIDHDTAETYDQMVTEDEITIKKTLSKMLREIGFNS